jgi:general secretion pathway protein H
MARKAGQVHPQTLATDAHDIRQEQGFTLLEMLCVLAIISLLISLVLPALPRGTSTARLQSYAITTAAMLKADRNAALRRHVDVTTEINANSRWVRSGATGDTIRFPDDVAVDALLARRCNGQISSSAITFFPSGLSCGGVITLSKAGLGYEVRVNWLTGEVHIVSQEQG